MSKRTGGFFIFLFIVLAPGFQDLKAQDFFSRLFGSPDKSVYQKHKKTDRNKRNNCGEMPAYNKLKAYNKYKSSLKKNSKGKPARELVKRSTSPGQRDSTALARRTDKPLLPPPPQVTSKNPPMKPKPEPPSNKTSTDTPGPGQEQTPPIAKAKPLAPKPSEATATVKKNVVPLSREQLRKMTLEERRDTLQKISPTLVLPPIQFISDQDEFSVVNMDSFMQAMEYAQQGNVVLIEGHTDDLGSDAYNLKLSMKRAEKIRQLLLSGDVGDELISVIGYGERQPVVPNTSTENRAINRRIEFKIFSISAD